MPEGAEVRRCADQLSQHLLNRTVIKLEAISGKLKKAGVKGLDAVTLPRTITKIFTKGKVIFIGFEGEDHWLISTLGMSGWWYPQVDLGEQMAYVSGKGLQKSADVVDQALKYARFKITLDDGSAMFYCDMRNFGNLYATDHDGRFEKEESLGPDLLTESARTLTWALVKAPGSVEIGTTLLNQKVIAGLGNIYRAETLYLAGISPHRTRSSLSLEEVERIVRFGQSILKNAYHTHGMMTYSLDEILLHTRGRLRDLMSEIKPPAGMALSVGKIRGLLVYSRGSDMFGNPVSRDALTGRTMWWVPAVQV